MQTVAQAIEEMHRLKVKRLRTICQRLDGRRRFSAYADDYLAYIKSGVGIKKPGTVAKEENTLRNGRSILGTPARQDQAGACQLLHRKRLQSEISKRTVKLDIIALRNVLSGRGY